jgi:hypothetical protein
MLQQQLFYFVVFVAERQVLRVCPHGSGGLKQKELGIQVEK